MATSEAVKMLVSGATLTIGRQEAALVLVETTVYADMYAFSGTIRDMMTRLLKSFDAEKALVSVNYTRDSLCQSFLEAGRDERNAALMATSLFGSIVTALGNAKVR